MSRILLFMALMLCGCNDSIHPTATERSINNSDLIGKWEQVDAKNGKCINDMPSRIIINEDGTVEFFGLLLDNMQHMVKCSGEWQLHHNIKGQVVNLVERNIFKTILLNEGITYVKKWSISIYKGEYIIWQYIGDPDACEYCIYRRR